MVSLDDLHARIPLAEIASKLGAEEDDVGRAIHTLVPLLLSGLHQTSHVTQHADEIESAANARAAPGLLDAGGGVDRFDEGDGNQAVATLLARTSIR
ncbi:hypothetical protein F0Q45_26690 [Mycobacterium simiae]|uniref:Uncharacterized protein n=1 Tax=Mycobacterium simiae TaxID=1784 RepID=A0A5B1AV39_MYCSI|nr:DUF937 domain-containing protein [Mycobacterium simiae]KAA1239862.1 hypothetical protein F0Q45_26690 [Mycobacterium simiae]